MNLVDRILRDCFSDRNVMNMTSRKKRIRFVDLHRRSEIETSMSSAALRLRKLIVIDIAD
jgi:hypothetical protein